MDLVRESGIGRVSADQAAALAGMIGESLQSNAETVAAERARGQAWAQCYDFRHAAAAYEQVYLRAAGTGPA